MMKSASCLPRHRVTEGLDIVDRHEIAVVVSDQGMPQMRGTEFLARVKEMSPDTVRIVLTGYADLTAAIDAINKGGVLPVPHEALG